jgi:ATP-dependent exoDNAse (exonuclease V) alpha subunit
VWDVQVLCAVNEKSPLARRTLNKQLQDWLNPDGKRIEGQPFRVGDKAICLQNGLLPAEGTGQDAADGNGKIYVANGELARVEAIQPRYTVARLSAPARLVRIPRGEGRDETDTGCSWDLGYAISGHKSQGSEWPIVIVMLDSYPGATRVCDRHWIYTAISRASQLCVLIGKPETAMAMCRRSQIWDRKTFLVEDVAALRTAGLERDWHGDLVEV